LRLFKFKPRSLHLFVFFRLALEYRLKLLLVLFEEVLALHHPLAETVVLKHEKSKKYVSVDGGKALVEPVRFLVLFFLFLSLLIELHGAGIRIKILLLRGEPVVFFLLEFVGDVDFEVGVVVFVIV
jgi:hypothetical protein